jgi:hypothetical protein
MLYPGTDEVERRKAGAFQAFWLAEPIRQFIAAGHRLSEDALLHFAMRAGEPLADLDERWWKGTATGQLLKVLLALYHTYPALASWNNAVTIAERVASRENAPGSRTAQWGAKRQYLSVAHLWAAFCIRRFETRLEVGYDGYADFQSFLAESEGIRHWGQTCLPARSNGRPHLPPDVWHPDEGWQPLSRQPGWPDTGRIPPLKLPEELLAGLKPAGRPRRAR